MDDDTPPFFYVMNYASEAEGDVIDMVSGNPDWEPPEALREGLREYADAETDQFQYPPSVGLRELREEIAKRRGVDISQVIITNGAGEANHLAMAGGLEAVDGNEIILADPVYPYYDGRTSLLDAEKTLIPVDKDGHLNPETVHKRASEETAVIVVNSPNNPMGVTYDGDAIEQLLGVAEEYDALLVSDEVYDHFDYSGRFTSALSFDSPNRIVTNSFSKSMAVTGWRVGYAIFPREDRPAPYNELVDSARTRHMLTNVAISRPAQASVLRALRETDPSYYEAVREQMVERIDRFTSALDAAGAEYTEPEGSFYVMARFPGLPGTMENIEMLIDEAGVAGMPGEAFGDSRSDWMRFALVSPRVEEAAQRLAEFFE
ncbi:pyridoxal phosphate-dependent aminotransferase [Halovenus rubra]|uniref:Pyridoxal phosphate-dependent aminotransferase n=2 Tax=Halovenus rubra TaxID=869890 RepID=A0ACC7DYZ3_9EURY|nr:pyridoxal phosphate-dependent aminotransferase [Halovenus rubra]